MKKLIVSLAALAALSSAALAERNYDISSPPYGETGLMKRQNADVNAFSASKLIVKKTNFEKMSDSNDSQGKAN
jgi:hypothetical protein